VLKNVLRTSSKCSKANFLHPMDKTEIHIARCKLIIDFYEEKYGQISYVNNLRDLLKEEVASGDIKRMVALDYDIITSMTGELPPVQQVELLQRLKLLEGKGEIYENIALKAAKKALLIDGISTVEEAEVIHQYLCDDSDDLNEEERHRLEQMIHSFSGPDEGKIG